MASVPWTRTFSEFPTKSEFLDCYFRLRQSDAIKLAQEAIDQMLPPQSQDHSLDNPSSIERLRYLIQRSASSAVSIVTKPNPRDSLVRGFVTRWHSATFPSLLKYFSRPLALTLVDKPIHYHYNAQILSFCSRFSLLLPGVTSVLKANTAT